MEASRKGYRTIQLEDDVINDYYIKKKYIYIYIVFQLRKLIKSFGTTNFLDQNIILF